MGTRKLKVKRLHPAEAVMVSLCGRPSAKQSRLMAIARLEGATDAFVEAAERGDAELPAPDGQVAKEIRFDLQTAQVETRGGKKHYVVYGLAYNKPWEPEPGRTYTEAEVREALDSHGSFMTAEDIEAVAHRFMRISRGIDTNHDFTPGAAVPVESVIVRGAGAGWPRPDGEWWPEGGWILGCAIDGDAERERVERGLSDPEAEDGLRAYSIYIYARPEEVEVDVEVEDPKPEPRTEPETPAPPKPDPKAAPAPQPREEPEPDPVAPTLGLAGFFKKLFGLAREEGIDLSDLSDQPPATPETRAARPESDFGTVWKIVGAEAQFGELFYALQWVIYNIRYDDGIDDKAQAMAKAFDAAKATAIHLQSEVAGVSGQLRTEPDEDPLNLTAALRVLHATGRISDERLETLRSAAADLSKTLTEAIGTARGEDSEVTKAELQALLREELSSVKEEVAQVAARLDAVEQKNEDPKPEPEQRTEEDHAKVIREVLRAELAPIKDDLAKQAKRVERLENVAPAPSSPPNPTPETRSEDQQHAEYCNSLVGLG